MKFEYTVRVETKKTGGPREDREVIEEEIRQVIEEADPGTVWGPDGSEHEILDWTVITP